MAEKKSWIEVGRLQVTIDKKGRKYLAGKSLKDDMPICIIKSDPSGTGQEQAEYKLYAKS